MCGRRHKKNRKEKETKKVTTGKNKSQKQEWKREKGDKTGIRSKEVWVVERSKENEQFEEYRKNRF